MFIQYLKIAWRNLIKYRTQSLISIVGLAIGFTAFSFTLSWIRYEKSYDSFNPAVDRIYAISEIPQKDSEDRLTSPTALRDYLIQKFPEVEAATRMMRGCEYLPDPEQPDKTQWEKFIEDCRYLAYADTNFFKVFYPEIKIKYPSVLPEKANIITESIARKWGIKNSDIGYKVKSLDFIPMAIIKDNPIHSNVHFNLMFVLPEEESNWMSFGTFTFVRLHKGVDVDAFRKKLMTVRAKGFVVYGTDNGPERREVPVVKHFKLIPLSEIHYKYPAKSTTIRLNYLQYFSVVSLMVILCALLNYLMLFVNRIKIRSRELALRKVNGAADSQLLHQLLVEFLMVLLFSLFLGAMLTELLFPAFVKFSLLTAPKSYFMYSVLGYSLIMILVAWLTTYVVIGYFMKRSIKENIQTQTKGHRVLKNQFALLSIFLQLFIAVLLILCSVVFFLQYNLLSQRVGFDRKNIIAIEAYGEGLPISEILKLKGVEEVVPNLEKPFLAAMYRMKTVNSLRVTDKNQRTQIVEMEKTQVDSSFCRFLKIPILAGRNVRPGDQSVCLINETAKSKIGLDALDKTIEGKRIIGIIPDLAIPSPLIPIRPTMYELIINPNRFTCTSFVFRHSDDFKKTVFYPFLKKFPNFSISNAVLLNDLFADYTRSERNLFILLSFMTGVALLISIFGIYSMISLTCNQRRKEIAIRKVNGARVGDILHLFFRQYFAVMVLSCIVAFLVGVYIMKQWLEQYPRRISLDWWLFAGVFLLTSIIVLLSIISRVLKAANENPAEVVKGE